jgi:membrane associated rhomboid family serine protease
VRVATTALIALGVFAYLVFQGGSPTLSAETGIEFRCNAVEYGLIPYEVTHPGERLSDPYCQATPEEPGAAHHERRSDPGLVADAPTALTIPTSVLMHGSLLHLGLNMLFLWIFGSRLERRIGPWRLLGLYVLGAAATVAALIALAPDLPIATIGSSGAVAAVIGACLVRFPRENLTVFALPVAVLAGAWVAAQLLVAQLDLAQPVAGDGGDVAYLAQLGGLLAGAAVAAWTAKGPVARRKAWRSRTGGDRRMAGG